jgi:hypothetical protein
MKDEHGMPLPSKNSPLPWQTTECWDLRDEDGGILAVDFSTQADAKFAVHAANHIIEAREIVRRLAEWWENKEHPIGSLGIEASRLWADMQKGGGE